ncbi:MAG: EAL domain-containing protein [Treponema sp.]|nr:EAL domain-containing protein [Treponema sp.]
MRLKVSQEFFFDSIKSKDTLLIIDDNDIDRGILSSLLKEKYNILEAKDGKSGLEKLYANLTKVSVVLLDLHMPVMNGYDVLLEMESDSNLSSIPVMMLTSSSSDEDQITAFRKGAADFVSKPYNPLIIINRLEAIIRLRKSTDMLSLTAMDKQTGLYSGEFFFAYAEQIVRSHPELAFDVIAVNIESIKNISSRHGRKLANSLIRTIAMLLQDELKGREIMGRITSYRFAILAEHKSKEAYEELAKNLSDELKEGPVYPIIVKFGIYEQAGLGEGIASMHDKAEFALSTIQGKYNTNICFYDEKLRKRQEEEQNIIDNMESALANNEFEVYFQPKHGKDTGKTEGAEALVRWNSPKFGFMNPNSFIPLFEKNGFISKLDYYVWENVCKTIGECLKKSIPVVPVSINISRGDFDTKDLNLVIERLADQYSVPHELLHLELTESAYHDNPEQIRSIIEKLHKSGFIIELDDFGTGYSSISVLNQMTFDILKLDMSLVNGIHESKGHRILYSIQEMARLLDMKTVAEGCEDKATADELRRLGCNYIQGYYYSKPLPFNEFISYMQKNGYSSETQALK